MNARRHNDRRSAEDTASDGSEGVQTPDVAPSADGAQSPDGVDSADSSDGAQSTASYDALDDSDGVSIRTTVPSPGALRWAAATDVGLRRDTNEDAFVAQHPVFAVADGMGGHLAGEVASEMAVDTILGQFSDDPVAIDISEVTSSVKLANLEIFRESRTDASRQGMGTTLTALVRLDHDHLGLVNVGDSRAYVLRDGRMRRISVDHSYVQELINRGEIKPTDARTHPNRNIVTRALGVEPGIDVDAWVLPMVRGDRYLLCSDGLVDEVLDERIEAALSLHEDPTIAAHRLVELALQAGGRDNITVLVLDVIEGLDPNEVVPETTALLPVVEPVRPDPISGQIPVTRRVVADMTQADIDDTTGVIRRPTSGESGEFDPAALSAVQYIAPSESLTASAPRPRMPRRARLSVMSVVFIAIVVGVFVAAFAITAAYARSSYYLDFNEQGNVTVYKGRPGGVLWFDPTVDQVIQRNKASLVPADFDTIERQPTFENRADATRFAAQLDEVSIQPEVDVPATTPPPQTLQPTATSEP